MLLNLAIRYRKKTAYLLGTTFYLNLALPLKASVPPFPQKKVQNRYVLPTPSLGTFPETILNNRTDEVAFKKEEAENAHVSNEQSFDIGGPGQPEMSSFQSVNGGNMVDLFSGDFSYNVPLMDVGGYPINIHYNSGITMDQDASWVGLGFNINPGTISRNMRGLPDDFNGKDSITKIASIRENKTTGVKVSVQPEITGFPLSVTAGLGVFHNNYNGWGSEQSVNLAVSLSKKNGSELTYDETASNIKLALSNNSQTGLSISPSLNVGMKDIDNKSNLSTSSYGLSTGYHTRGGLSSLTINATNTKYKNDKYNRRPTSGVMGADISFAQPSITPGITMPTTSSNYAFHLKIGGEAFGLHANFFIDGYTNKQEIKQADKTQKKPAYGYLNYSKAKNDQHALLDFNREKELQYSYKTTPNIAIPQYTYDVYSISGEGTGGAIRPFRGDAGYVRDHYMRTKSSNDQFSGELGLGNTLHGGLSYDFVRSHTENSGWIGQNSMRGKLEFQETDSLYEAVYFRNPAEKTSNANSYYQQIGDDQLMRVKLNRSSLPNVSATNSFALFKNVNKTGELVANEVLKKENRDKRGQVVTYLNADEASVYGFTQHIQSFKENTIPVGTCADSFKVINRVDPEIRRGHHLSEISVLNPDGRRYVYGIPAYNIEQRDVTFSTAQEKNSGNLDRGVVGYAPGDDNSTENRKGKESYFNKEIVPAYAHSFLLTALLSPDYVDVKNDGITEDDIGDAIKFNYTQIYGPQSGRGDFEWRTPGSPADINKATYNEGLKSYSRDDKGSYIYGKKEVWYAHSVESKTMIALFKLSADRTDVYAASGENGGINTSKKLRKLDKIELYAKADLVKNGNNARPVKTVHFEYNYELCKGYNGDPNQGKLTLKKIWFSYNGNMKGKQNPYTFNYNTTNPAYHPKKYDRWGNFKEATLNPGSLNNADFPYAVQDSTTAAQNAGAWHLSDIRLPSGGRMKITYEGDDYAFVQDKRAMQMISIAGFGPTASSTPVNNLYTAAGAGFEYVFVNTPASVTNTEMVFQKYLEGAEWLYMKVAVVMPTNRWGSGYEFVPVYGKVAEYGKVPGQNRFWVRFEKVKGRSPMIRAAMEFLRNNLPSKAYPASELGDNINLGDAVKMLASSFTEIKNAVEGFVDASMSKAWCKNVEVSKSFIRLNAPEYIKHGGGHRVKKVEISDNWNNMTGQRESYYGQEYSYRTSIKINGAEQIISSGVATYEPMIGNEENPFRQPVPYTEKIAPLAPVSYLYSEMPMGESYFPGASVGYSKVRVRTINKKAKSANGWEETEFYTSKDFPTIVEHTLLDQDAKAKYKPQILNFFKVYSVERTTVSQGFKVELNDMNGKVKKTASYAENDSLNPIAYSLNFYKVDNYNAAKQKLNNTVWVVDSANGKIRRDGIIGKDIELITDFRQQYSLSVSGGISPNIDYFQIGIFPIPIPSLFKFPSFDETQFRSVATVKLIQKYGILDSVVVMDKGSVVSTKNLLYEGESGEVILSRTNNEFKDPVYSFSYPAHWGYSGMGMAYKNVHAEFKKISLVKGKLYYNNNVQEFPATKYFESGDEAWLKVKLRGLGTGENCNQFSVYNMVGGVPVYSPGKDTAMKVWAIDAAKGYEGDRGLYFIDSEGRPVTGEVQSIKILRSGKRNMLDASVGNIVSLDNPIKEISTGTYKLVLDSTLRVINTAAATYKDLWQVENSMYQKDTVYRVVRYYNIMLEPTEITTRLLTRKTSDDKDYENSYAINSKSLISSFDYIRNGTFSRSGTMRSKSTLSFDFSAIPKDATILYAQMQFTKRVPNVPFPRQKFPNGTTYDWSTATNYYHGDSRVNLKRITAPWNPGIKYESFVTSAVNQVQFSNSVTGASCTNLVQDAINLPTYGFMFEMVRQNPNSGGTSEINYLSFCSNHPGTSGLWDCGIATKAANNGGAQPMALAPGCYCAKPQLAIYYRTIVDSIGTVCRYNINDTATNPYRWGILGNWRMDRAYTFYHDRVETNASNPETDIRKEGVLKSFTPYWQLNNPVLTASPDTSKWVWNSAMSMYNRKGFEIENYDPLGRYNAGLYGYNQTLPVAVAQNSHHRDMLFDGFEDYQYATKSCATCPNAREFDFIKDRTGVTLSTAESHTGNYSMRITAGNESILSVPVTSNTIDLSPKLSLQIDSTPIYIVNVVGTGNGLTGSYSGMQGTLCNTSVAGLTRTDAAVNFSWAPVTAPYPGICASKLYTVKWTGKVQAPYTGRYSFSVAHTGGRAGIKIEDGTTVMALRTTIQQSGNVTTVPLDLVQGKLYNITIEFIRTSITGTTIALSWIDQNNIKTAIPQKYLYASGLPLDTAGSVQSNIRFYCIKANNTKPVNIIKPKFSPYQQNTLLVSAWIKLEGADCNVAPALTDAITVQTDGITPVTLEKTGNRIEGWQRYEGYIATGTTNNLHLKFKATQGRTIYVDDIRVQPYNSHLKGYVYDAVNLRLMAELDENNYASFYEYDDDGTLIRVKKETEKGIMTIKETRSALLKDEN
jgi:hypothetical protein